MNKFQRRLETALERAAWRIFGPFFRWMYEPFKEKALASCASRVYSGSTAASSVSNPPVLISRLAGARSILGTSGLTAWSSGVTRAGGLGMWQYISTNLTTDLTAAGFFSDGAQLGMQVGDILQFVEYTSAGSSFIIGQGVLSTTNSSNGFNIASTGAFRSSTS